MAGRPLKFQDKDELERKITEYFNMCDEKGKPYTITGLAVALDTYRSVLIDYEEKDEFSYTIKKAKEKIHQWTEEYLFTGKNQTGAIFNLKNNYGWRDKTEQETTVILPKPIMDIDDLQQNDINKEDNSADQED